MKRLQYLKKLKQNHKTAIRIAFLNPDETVQREITNEIYNISGNINVNYQDGARRTCTITINNANNVFPIGWNGFWIGQKFQIWTGLYLDYEEKEPYYISQGIFYIKNPKETYNPTTKSITLQGVDKWAFLDGSLFGNLPGTYKSMADTQDIRKQVEGLLKQNRFDNKLSLTENILEMIDFKKPIFDYENEEIYENQYTIDTGHLIYTDSLDPTDSINLFVIDISTTSTTYYKVTSTTTNGVTTYNKSNTTYSPTYKDTIFQNNRNIFTQPYTVTTEVGKTFADVMLEYKNMLLGKVFYDREGYLRFEPISTSMSDFSDNNREIAWHFTVTEQELLGLEMENKFDSVFNDVIVLGAIVNGRQAKARIQNQDPESETSISRIGIKTKAPYESDQYYSDSQCQALAQFYAQTDMAMEKAGTISSLPIYHLDVGQIVTISTPNNFMNQEEYLVTGFSYTLGGNMNITVTNLRYFKKWTVVPIE